VAWDDPRSPFKGVRRFVDVNANNVRTPTGPRSGTPIRSVATAAPSRSRARSGSGSRGHDNTGLDLHGAVMGRNRDYDAPGVRAPN
jgi:hypothetical protein